MKRMTQYVCVFGSSTGGAFKQYLPFCRFPVQQYNDNAKEVQELFGIIYPDFTEFHFEKDGEYVADIKTFDLETVRSLAAEGKEVWKLVRNYAKKRDHIII